MSKPFHINDPEFFLADHIKCCKHCIYTLPQRFESLDVPRTVTLFFAISSLDYIDSLHEIEKDKKIFIDWIYSMQAVQDKSDNSAVHYGFRASLTCETFPHKNSLFSERPHLASTYASLSTLLILGDDLSRVKKQDILSSLKHQQLDNGCFYPIASENCESDMRFLYCASTICYILDDWSTIDVDKAVDFIKRSRNYDGGIGQGPGLESHGGSTFCAIASLWLMKRLDTAFSKKELKDLKRWLVFRQDKCFHGRPNKPDDTCYAFWVGATLKILGCYDLIDYSEVHKFILCNQHRYSGGISKWSVLDPDLLHTYFGLGGLLLKDHDKPRVFPALNISQKAADFLKQLHIKWRNEQS